MRPHKLIMKAFGPFAQETVVDFDAMGDHIYLIAGDTGAGKTTIFDAIVYALYGRASGEGRSALSTEAFHSDYAKDGRHREELYVGLTFTGGGRTLTVTRRMYWGRKGDAQKAVKESALSENGTLLAYDRGLEYRDEVSARITELLGLDADQFRRIVMLAQGEFRRFLEAGSNQREEILGKLYDNRQHRDVQVRLKAARNQLERRMQELAMQEQAQLNLLQIPEQISTEEREKLTPGHPALPEALETIRAQLEAALSQCKEQVKRLEAQQEKLAQLQRAKEQLEKEKREIARMEERIRELEQAQKTLTQKGAELAERAAQLAQQNGEKAEGIQKEKNLLEQVLPLYEALSESQRACERAQRILTAARTDALHAQEAHLELNRAFLSGQAGLLAAELQQELERKGQAACPVCGVVHKKGEAASFAPLLSGTPTREQVEKARLLREQAEQAEKSAEGALQQAKTLLQERQARLERYPERQEQAKERLALLQQQLRGLQAETDQAVRARDRCRTELAGVQGNLRQAREQEMHLKEAVRTSQAALEQLQAEQEIRQMDQEADVASSLKAVEEKLKTSRLLQGQLQSRFEGIRQALDLLRQIRAQLQELDKKLRVVKPLADAANGSCTFSRYVLNDFFGRIIEQANVHLETMTDGEYCLVPTRTGDGRRNIGLGLRVLNTITGIERETASLSGGQSFEAALALALGLSDVVQMDSTSRVRIESMFIDEGFGSLDGVHLDRALEVLSHLSAGTRQIGIISHVSRLEEVLPKKLRVIPGPGGSRVEVETDV